MAKYNISRLLETTRLLATEAGGQLKDLISYTSEMAENVARLLRNGLTFQDNFSCEIREVSLKHDTTAIVGATKPVTGILPIRVLSTSTGLDSFSWYYDDQGRLTVKAGFTGSPAAAQKMTLVMLF
jgi:hypothetical protein